MILPFLILFGLTLALMLGVTVARDFINPHNVKHGATDINTVASIALRKSWQRLAGQGDNDLSDSVQFKVNLQVGGTITLRDPIQGDALLDAPSSTLLWDQVAEAGGTNLQNTVTGVEFFTLDETDAHNALTGVSLGWNAFSPTGIDPHSSALVSP